MDDERRFWQCEGCGREAPYVRGNIESHCRGRITRNKQGPSRPLDDPCSKCGGEMLLWVAHDVEYAGDDYSI